MTDSSPGTPSPLPETEAVLPRCPLCAPSCWAPHLVWRTPAPVPVGSVQAASFVCGGPLPEIERDLTGPCEDTWHVAWPRHLLLHRCRPLPFGTVPGDVCALGPFTGSARRTGHRREEPCVERCGGWRAGGVSLTLTFLAPRSPEVCPGAAPRGEAERSQLPGPRREEDGPVRP